MKISKKKGIAIGALALSLALISVPAAQAANGGAFGRMDKENHKSEMVAALSQRFNLKPAEVEKVFTEQHEKMEALRMQTQKDKLTADVNAGKITQAQADLIIAKRAEMHSLRESLSGKTKEEIMTTMKIQKTNLDQWAKDNNIPVGYLMGGGFGGGKDGHRGGMMKGVMLK